MDWMRMTPSIMAEPSVAFLHHPSAFPWRTPIAFVPGRRAACAVRPLMASQAGAFASGMTQAEGAGAVACALSARHLLLAEDEALLSLELSMALEEAGAEVRATFSLDDTLLAAREGSFDAAVLDVNLAGREVFPAASVLAERGVPLVFHTGHAKGAEIALEYPASVTLAKPVATDRVVDAVSCAIGSANGGATPGV